jgi:hypothetical protein
VLNLDFGATASDLIQLVVTGGAVTYRTDGIVLTIAGGGVFSSAYKLQGSAGIGTTTIAQGSTTGLTTNIKTVLIANESGVVATVTPQGVINAGTARSLFAACAIPIGGTLAFVDGAGWALYNASGQLITSIASVWGSITGTLSNQSDLQTALNAKLTAPVDKYISSGTSDTVASLVNTICEWESATPGAKTENVPTATGSGVVITIIDLAGTADLYNIRFVPATGTVVGASAGADLVTNNFQSASWRDVSRGGSPKWVRI